MNSAGGLCLWLILLSINPIQSHRGLSSFGHISVEQRAGAPVNCPWQPEPQSLPNPLPVSITNAFKEIDRIAVNTLDEKTIPGVALGVSYKGETIYSTGFGVKTRGYVTPPDADTIFRIGSVSKIFPIIMIYQFLEEGIIDSLDDPIEKYVPEFEVINPFSKTKITLRQMASQLSGLQRTTPCNETVGTIKQCRVSNKDILNELRRLRLIHPPWTTPSYSNFAYALLGRLLVPLYNKDMSFEEYVQIKIINPLDLKNTGFNITLEVEAKMATGYMPDGSIAPLVDIGWESPAGQMYSTINDLNKLSSFFYEAYPERHKTEIPIHDYILETATRREMSLPYYVNPDRQTGFGTPWEIHYRGNYTIRTKGGNIDGYSAIFSFIPELHLGINALFSGAYDAGIFVDQAFDTLLPPLVNYLSSLPPRITPPPNPEPYVGTFAGEGIEVVVYVESNILYTRTNGTVAAMDYWEDNMLQIYIDETNSPCFLSEVLGEQGEWIYYDPNYVNAKSPAFEIPGVFPGLILKRVN